MEYWLEGANSLLKFLGLLLPAIATALGLIVEYKTPDKHLTKWGRRAIALTIFTALVSSTSYYLDQRKTRLSIEAAARDAEEAGRLLKQSAEAALRHPCSLQQQPARAPTPQIRPWWR